MKKHALCIKLLVIARDHPYDKKKLIIDISPYINDKDMKFYTLIVGTMVYKTNILLFSIMAEFCDDVIIFIFS